MKKYKLLFAVILFIQGLNLQADEGMFLPLYIDRLNYTDMQKMGLQLTPEEIYSVNNSSMKDAIVGLSGSKTPRGFFCSGGIVSEEGMFFTNHHCGFHGIQELSSLENDYLADGFWAYNKSEELWVDVTASILIRMEDITDSIIPHLSDTMSFENRNNTAKTIIDRISDNNSEDGKYHVVIKSFYSGNEYYMFIYEVYKDVRLVGAPPSSIGSFGGDTDNWMWPRHTGDFSIFRIYTAPDGSPAEYSEDNVPLKPKYHFPISTKGIKEHDFTMVWGFPGTTERYLTSYGIQYDTKYYYPPLAHVFKEKLYIWKKHMDTDNEIKIKYASKHASLANFKKKIVGLSKGVVDLDVIKARQEIEKKFIRWYSNDNKRYERYGTVLNDIDMIYNERSEGIKPLIYSQLSGLGGSEIIELSQYFSTLYSQLLQYNKEKDKEEKAILKKEIENTIDALIPRVEKFFKDYDKVTDKELLAAMIEVYINNLSADFHPAYLNKLLSKNDGDVYKTSEYIFQKSFLCSQNEVEEFLKNPDAKSLEKDPAFQLMQGYSEKMQIVSQNYKRSAPEMRKAERLFLDGLRQMPGNKNLYPDANSTLRFSYGTVMDYYPRDAVKFNYTTYLTGVMEKENPNDSEFIVPEKLKDLYESKDYGSYADKDGRMVLCFLTNNDITGGNSGSPVLNGNGELIGLAFDGNWEAMSSDLSFAPDLQRTIVVDSRYVLFIIDKFAGATNLIDELSLRNN